MGNGRSVEFTVYEGRHQGAKNPLGSLSFQEHEWQAFRPFLVGGMRMASYQRIEIEFLDQTRMKPKGVN